MDSAVSKDWCHALVGRIMKRRAEKAGGIPWPAMQLTFFLGEKEIPPFLSLFSSRTSHITIFVRK
jgi:hypothetical protein